MAKVWEVENAKFNITSNTISPSFMLTPQTMQMDERLISKFKAESNNELQTVENVSIKIADFLVTLVKNFSTIYYSNFVFAMKILKKSNYNSIIKTRSTIIKPITENEITENYVSWLNDREINKFLEVRHTKQTKDKVVNYINSIRKRNDCDMFAIFDAETKIHIGNLTITSFDTNSNGQLILVL